MIALTTLSKCFVRLLPATVLLLCSQQVQAQVQVFFEDFGSGSAVPGPPISSGTTSLCYENLTNICPEPADSGSDGTPVDDGEYSVLNTPMDGFPGVFRDMPDHTSGDIDGYMMMINADYDPDIMYTRPITIPAVWPNRTLFVRGFVANVLGETRCSGSGIQPNVAFNLYNSSSVLIANFSSGDIPQNLDSAGPEVWVEMSSQVQVPDGETNFSIEFVNNALGGCGNDLVLDDLEAEILSVVAFDDTLETLGSIIGGTTSDTILTNDLINGTSFVLADITLTPGTAPVPVSGSLLMNAIGAVTIVPGTTAGSYIYPYTICSVIDPANCSNAEATIEIIGMASIEANRDTAGVTDGSIGANDVINVLDNDDLNGSVPTNVVVAVSPVSPPLPTGISLNSDGSVDVGSGTASGFYTFEYEICSISIPALCDTAWVEIPVGDSNPPPPFIGSPPTPLTCATPNTFADDYNSWTVGSNWQFGVRADGGLMNDANSSGGNASSRIVSPSVDMTSIGFFSRLVVVVPVQANNLQHRPYSGDPGQPDDRTATLTIRIRDNLTSTETTYVSIFNPVNADVDPTSAYSGPGSIVTALNGATVNATAISLTNYAGPTNQLAFTIPLPNLTDASFVLEMEASGDDFSVSPITYYAQPEVEAGCIPAPALQLTKTAGAIVDTNANAITDAGDTLSYSFRVENTGNVTLSGIALSDSIAAVSGGPIASLAPGGIDSASFSATYVLQLSDFDVGGVENSATITASSPGNSDDVSDVSDTGAGNEASNDLDLGEPGDPSGDTSDDDGDPTNDPTVTLLSPAPADGSISGTVYLDIDGDAIYDLGLDPPQPGYEVNLRDDMGAVAATTTTQPDGSYSITGIAVGTDFSVDFVAPGTSLVSGNLTGLDFGPSTVLENQNQPIDPSGVVYVSSTGIALSGVTLVLTDDTGTPLPAACLANGQQPQTTDSTGVYLFDLIAGSTTSCPVSETEYQIAITSFPTGYLNGFSANFPPLTGVLDATTCPGDIVPGGACQISATATPGPGGGTYYTAFDLAAGDPNVIYNHIPLDPIATESQTGITISKITGVQSVVVGQTVPYAIEIANSNASATGPVVIVDRLPSGMVYVVGSAQLDGADITPAANGLRLTFNIPTVPANGSTRLVLSARITGSVGFGRLTNSADVIDSSSGQSLAETARASVIVRPEAVFDCSDIIGKVFDDKNHNGYQDKGEPGLPGVRLSTVTGILITTDKFGRYHVPCAAIPTNIGSNFYLKVDTRTLPSGYRITTENPRVVRVTRGKVTKLNFGASISHVVDIDLTSRAFANGSATPDPRLVVGLKVLVERMRNTPSILSIAYYTRKDDPRLVRKRMDVVEQLVRKNWKNRGRYKLSIERTIKRMN